MNRVSQSTGILSKEGSSLQCVLWCKVKRITICIRFSNENSNHDSAKKIFFFFFALEISILNSPEVLQEEVAI